MNFAISQDVVYTFSVPSASAALAVIAGKNVVPATATVSAKLATHFKILFIFASPP